MNTPKSIQILAEARIIEAENLCSIGHYDLAYYVAGYAIELFLKAKIATLLNIPNFYDFGNREKFVNEDNLTKPYKVHNFEQLLILSGLFLEHKNLLLDNKYRSYWSKLALWKEDIRYSFGKGENDVTEFINCVKNYSTWIKQYL